MTYCLPTYANEQDIVNSFTNFTNNIVSEVQANYNTTPYKVKYIIVSEREKVFNKAGNYWVKFGKTNLRSSINIKRTDSLITPYIGYLILSCDFIDYYSSNNNNGEFKTKEQAEKAFLLRINPSNDETRFTYAYQNGKWILKYVEWRTPLINNGLWVQSDLKTPQERFLIH